MFAWLIQVLRRGAGTVSAPGETQTCPSTQEPLRVAIFPAPSPESDSYLYLLRRAVEGSGAPSISSGRLRRGWLTSRGELPTVVHLHWLEFLAPSDRRARSGAVRTCARSWRLILALAELRRRGIAIVWTIHNLAPHEPAHPLIERALAQVVMALVNRAIVHSDHAKRLIAARLGFRRKLITIAHGNYLGVYPPADSAQDRLRRAYGLPIDAYVYLAFGQIRGYKRLHELIAAFREVPGDDGVLLIVGEPRDDRAAAELRRLASQDERVRLDLRRVPTAEVSAIHALADAAVFPYADMFSSGSLMLALSCSLPVVVPADSTGTEIAPVPAGQPIAPDGLRAALAAVRQGDQSVRRRAARAIAERHNWDTVGRLTVDVYDAAQRDATRRRSR